MSYRPVELRSYLEQAQAEQRTVTVKDVLWPAKTGEARWLDVIVSPLQDGVGKLIGATISLSDVTMFKHLQEELERANQELETAYEELQSTNEELETTNEELQSTVEELETTNEELQSTNEELETINEEMESSNEELHAVNDELRRRGDELNHMNAFQEAILTSLRGGVVVVDMDSRVQIWNRRSEDLWGLRREEVQGRNLLMLDFGLPVENLKRPLRACLTGAVETENILLRATNRRGRTILCRVTCVPLVGVSTDVQGAILVMDEVSGEVAESSPQTKPE
jgi:two-component system CheB/CheR fusion protein